MEIDFSKFRPPMTTHRQFTDEEYRENCHEYEINRIHIFRHYLISMKNYGIMSERIYNKLMKNLRKKAAEEGIQFS